ncbi:MAG: hypothetical protein Q8P29_02435 [Candidatus Levybacteria bacterium]|nr:hypothetical protein [Candidatus Levybacteria bacterium]
MLIYAFLAGLFLTNSIPHLIKGISGQTHMTPFKRVSPAWLNIIWSFINIYLGLLFLQMSGGHLGDIINLDSFAWSFLIGALFIALADANLFSKPDARLPWHKD